MPRRVSTRAKRVWRRLGQNYGARLADQFGPSCPEDWCDVIDRTDDERLDKALTKIRGEHLQFPPTLGQFEAAIPKRQFGGNQDSIPDRLACYAVKTLNLCEHQLPLPWSYFGHHVDDGSKYGYYDITGVIIESCRVESCHKFGQPNHRILASDLPA